ncbi:MAG: hypothetical protein WBB74_06895 [Gaiellaceae bacterium]
MSGLWLPGTAGPQDQLVDAVHRLIEGFGREHPGRTAVVEIELREGPQAMLETISAEPGYGFVSLRPHPEEEGDAEEWIVPVGSIARIVLREAEEHVSFGFALPESS